jgi:iron complex outermembrane receptor protein
MQEHDVYGLFGQIDIDLNSFFSLKAGLRWSREEKNAVVTYVRTRDECSVIEGTCPYTGERVPGENNGFADKRSWDNVSPRVVATWRATEDMRIYASWSRGFRSGGYNFRITQPDAFEDVAAMLGSPAFDRERVDTFEVGTKWQSPDRLLFLQGALFWSEVDNLQREVVVPSLTAGLAQSIFNTADARIRGLELDASLQPADGLSLSANFGLTEADYQEVFFDLSGDGVIDDADLALELPRAPKLTWGATANYEVPLSRSKVLSANVYFQHRDRYAYSDNNWGFNYGSERLDASISVSCLDCGVTLTLFGRNLLDEVQFGADAGLPFAGGPFSNGVNAPFDPSPAAGTFSPINKGRTLGVELGVEF